MPKNINLSYEPGPVKFMSKRDIDLMNFKTTIEQLRKKSSAAPQSGEHMCKDCFEIKPLNQFTKCITAADGYTHVCKMCRKNKVRYQKFLKRYGSI